MPHRMAIGWVLAAVAAAGIVAGCSGSSSTDGWDTSVTGSSAPTSSPPAETASPPGQSATATAGPSASRPATTDPNYWTGTITYQFAGSAGGPDSEGQTTSGTYNDSATFVVVLGRDTTTSSGASWSVVTGTALGSEDEDLRETSNGGGLWRMTLHGGGWGSVPRGACRVTFAADRGSYSIECGGVEVGPVEYTGYEGDLVGEGPRNITWSAPPFSLRGISMPSGSTGLSGSRKADVWVPTAGSKPVQVQADVSWNLTPKSGATPTTPPDVTGSLSVDGPPLGMSITQPGQRAVVALPLLGGQRVAIKVTGNTIGAVKVSLIKKNGGSPLAITSSSSSSFDLPAQALGTAGPYSIVVEPKPGNTGDITLSVATL